MYGLDTLIVEVYIESLVGSPKMVTGNFYCQNNLLTTLEGAPETCHGVFNCNNNPNLTSLKGVPFGITDLSFDFCGVTSLEYSPKTLAGTFSCIANEFTSLKGCPDKITGLFNCSENELESLEGMPRIIGKDCHMAKCRLTSLKNIHKHIKSIGGNFVATSNEITSNVLGLLLIEGIKEIVLENIQVSDILNAHLSKRREGVMDAQRELIDAGLPEFARL